MEKVTVITVCFNAENLIQKTVMSVLGQTYKELEYVIVDGASTDNTMRLVEKTVEKFRNRKPVIWSEQDNGIYDAMNKAVGMASGEWILFLNAGDLFASADIIERLFMGTNLENYDGIYGDTIRVKDGKQLYVKGNPLCKIAEYIPLPFCHQSVFVRKKWLVEYPFDLKYKQAGDYNFFSQLYLADCNFKYVNLPVSLYLMGGVSETNNIAHLKEKIAIREEMGFEHYTMLKKIWLVNRLKLRHFIKRFIPKKILEKLQGFS